MELIRPGTNFDFIGKRKYFLALTLVLIGIGILSLIVKGGPRFGIEFAGGSMVQVAFNKDVSIDQVRDALEGTLEGKPVVQSVLGKDREFMVFTEKTPEDLGGAGKIIQNTLAKSFGADSVQISQTKMVGPKVGKELRTKGLLAVLIAFGAMLAYIWFRFEFDFGLGAIAATFHDVMVMVGYFSVFNKEFDLTFVAALLTIVGFSMNDTVVVFDRIRETMGRMGDRASMAEIMNRSINETLSRTILTSFTVIVSIIVLLALGGAAVHDFAVAMMVGVVTGTFSSIYIASPIVLWVHEYQARRKKAAATA